MGCIAMRINEDTMLLSMTVCSACVSLMTLPATNFTVAEG